MRRVLLRCCIGLCLGSMYSVFSDSVQASSYLQADLDDENFWVEVDPIQVVGGEADHWYAGPNLGPYVVVPRGANLRHADLVAARLDYADLCTANLNSADLQTANLAYAELRFANLRFADLSGSNLGYADLGNAKLRYALLNGAKLDYANLVGADLRGVDLGDAVYLGLTIGPPYYDAETDFTGAWSGGVGSAPFDPQEAGWTFVPEASAGLLSTAALMTLAGLTVRRRPASP